MSTSTVQLVRLVSLKTEARRTSSGTSSSSELASRDYLGSRRRASSAAQPDRFSRSTHRYRGSEQDASENVGIEVFAHGALGKEAVLVAFLSNSVLLVVRCVPEGLRSWLLEWPVAGKIRGLCVSPDLQCILCVTQGLEGVYLLAIDNLGEQDEAQPHPPESIPNLDDRVVGGASSSALGGDGASGGGGTSTGNQGGKTKRSPAATARQAPKRTVADAAFPSLVHLASRGEQRKRAGSTKARYPLAEPVFIASLARRGGGAGDQQQQESDDGRGGRRHSTGLGGLGPRRRAGSRTAAAPFECLWWATRDGDHFAIIGGPGGEVHFLDLERLGAWVVAPPPPVMARGRVSALSIVAELAGTSQPPRPSERAEGESPPVLPDKALEKSAAAPAENEHSHLVAVLETGAVFVVLLERRSWDTGSDGGSESKGEDGSKKTEQRGGKKGGDEDRSSRGYIRLGADEASRPEFAPSWLDVGRGGGGGGGGGMGVRVVPSFGPPGSCGNDSCGRLRMSVVSRAWGNKCAVKILRVAGTPGAAGGTGDKDKEQQQQPQQQGWGLEWGISGGGKQQALRTETVRQVTLPVDHAVPERHALAVVDGSYAVLASPPAGGAPARVTVAPLGGPERPASHPACVFPLPAGEHVNGVALLPCGDEGIADETGGKTTGPPTSWGLVWSESGVYRVDLCADATAAAAPKSAGTGKDSSPPQSQPTPTNPLTRLPPTPARQSATKAASSIALRRPSAASMRRARELHAAGQLSEAVEVAMDALDGSQSSSTTPTRGSGGGVTTRMVREELANSLLEWLVSLHVRQAAARPAVDMSTGVVVGTSFSGTVGTVDSSKIRIPEGDKSKARRSSTGSPSGGSMLRSAARRGSKLTPPSSRVGSRGGPNKRDSAAATSKTTTGKAAPPAAPFSQLERYLVSSCDYDPVLATTLLHEHGESDLAVVAGTAREGKDRGGAAVLSRVLRVLADSAWPPRLGPRAVEALCRDETGAAAREVIRAGGGTLFAALEPCLQLRVLLSDKGILFGGAEVGGGSPANEEARRTGAVGDATETKQPVAGGASAGVRRHLSPIVPALSAEELNMLVSRLAKWCKEDVAGPRTGGETEGAVPIDDKSCPSLAALEGLEVLLEALCELSRRPPPPGEHHRRAWSHAGCILDVPAVHEGGASKVARLEWAQLAAWLYSILSGEGEALAGGGGGGGDAGGLPAAARRWLLRVLPVVRGWHDSVRALLRLREAGCWAAVALQLELAGNGPEAATATLHGVVDLLQGGEGGEPGEAARILNGKGYRRLSEGFGAQEQAGSPDAANAEADNKRTASEAVLRVVDRHAFSIERSDGTATAARTGRANVSSRASVLKEALFVWKHFDLPLPALEASLLPRLDHQADARVLMAVFFPQLSRDSLLRSGAPSGDPPAARQRYPGREREFGGTAGRRRQQASRNEAHPYLQDLGLSPRFFLALTRAARKPAGTGSLPAAASDRSSSPRHAHSTGRNSGDGGVVGGVVGSAVTWNHSPLNLLLERRAGGGCAGHASSSVRLAAPAAAASATAGARAAGRVEGGSAWPPGPRSGGSGGQGYAPSEDLAVWIFSCGHSFSRRHLLDAVVPASVSSVRQATASLERTQQVLTLEYEGEGSGSASAGAACPECAARELIRLAAVAGASMQSRGLANGSAVVPSSPPPPPSTFQARERARIR